MAYAYRVFAGICVATVLTQTLIVGLSALRGNLDEGAVVKIVGLLNGIDISGRRVAEAVREVRQEETPDYQEILERRALESIELDMRRQSLANHLEFIRSREIQLRAEQEAFDRRRESFKAQLETLEKDIEDDALQELQKTLGTLQSENAKDQIVRMIENNEMDKVVAIVQGMPADKQKKILGEFQTPQEAEHLAEILRRIGEGDPKKSLIENALDGL